MHIVSDDGDKGYCFLFIYIYKYLAGVCQAASVFSKRAQLVCRPVPLLLPVLSFSEHLWEGPLVSLVPQGSNPFVF